MFHYKVTHQSRFGEDVYHFSSANFIGDENLQNFGKDFEPITDEAAAIVEWLKIDFHPNRTDEYVCLEEVPVGPIWKGIQ